MGKSLLKLLVFSLLPLLVIGYAIFLTGRKTDDFYKRFSSPQQNSLILGSSRAAGMNPAILDSIINKKFPEVKLYNYAFTWAHSPYGPKYLESIKKKLKPNTKNGFFIVTVEPTALMIDAKTPDDPKYYVENDKSVARTSSVASEPNLEYFLESYDYSITREINSKILPPENVIADVEILDNGKLYTKILKSNSPQKQAEFNAGRMKDLDQKLSKLAKSNKRLHYLEETIRFLKMHGKVILVRLPIQKTPYSIENKYYGNFDREMTKIAGQEKIQYINYNLAENHYQCTDEVHLTSKSMDEFSLDLGRDIVKSQIRKVK